MNDQQSSYTGQAAAGAHATSGGCQGVIATSDPRASTAGAHVLACGGNAVDAAVTAAAVLFVVEPHACGPGGDAFLLLKQPGKAPAALDGAGAVPAGLIRRGKGAGEPVPLAGAGSVTVPGAVSLLDAALARYGTIGLADAAAPAIRLARNGYTVRSALAAACQRARPLLAGDAALRDLYLPRGRPVEAGDVVCNAQLAEALTSIALGGAAVFYEGALADALAERVGRLGGVLSRQDLAAHATVPMVPDSVTFRGTDVWELPAPTQGPAVLAALDALEHSGRFDPPTVIDALVTGLRAAGIDLPGTGRPPGRTGNGGAGDTTYVAAIDGDGLGVSLITSIFSDFGSGVGIDALGGPVHNRAATFALSGQRPRPGKPPHTTIPALVTRSGDLACVLGVTGGYMQAQGQVQVLINLLVHGMSPQEAVNAPRLRVLAGGGLAVEAGHPLAHDQPQLTRTDPGPGAFGGCQIASYAGGRLSGAADPRKGGLVVVV